MQRCNNSDRSKQCVRRAGQQRGGGWGGVGRVWKPTIRVGLSGSLVGGVYDEADLLNVVHAALDGLRHDAPVDHDEVAEHLHTQEPLATFALPSGSPTQLREHRYTERITHAKG